MKIPWRFWERRDSYTDILVNALVDAAENPAKSANATAAVEAAAWAYQSAFQAAKLDPKLPALSPSFLGDLVRQLVRHGQAIYEIGVSGGVIILRPATSWTITGGADEGAWVYRVERQGPTSSTSKTIPSAGVLHFRYATLPGRSWEGLGPLQFATATGTLAGVLEQRLGEEAGAPSALLLPIPGDGGDGGEGDPLAEMKSDLAKARGRPVVLKTTASGWGEGPAAAPRRDWAQSRIGAHPPDVLRSLRKDVIESLVTACGVPVSLVNDGDGTGQRESWRRFVMGSCEPLSARIAEELSRKLDLASLDFDFGSLWAHDVVGRTTAFQKLIAGGMAVEEAARLSGVLSE